MALGSEQLQPKVSIGSPSFGKSYISIIEAERSAICRDNQLDDLVTVTALNFGGGGGEGGRMD